MALFEQTNLTQDEIDIMLEFAEILYNETKNDKYGIRAVNVNQNYKPTHYVTNEKIIKEEQRNKYKNYDDLKNKVFSIAHEYVFENFKNINSSVLKKDLMYCCLNYLIVEPDGSYEGMRWHKDDRTDGEPDDNADVIIFYLKKDNIIGADLQIKNPDVETIPINAGDILYIHGSLVHQVTTATGDGKRIALMFIYPRA